MNKLYLLITARDISTCQGLNLGYGSDKIPELSMKRKLPQRKPRKIR